MIAAMAVFNSADNCDHKVDSAAPETVIATFGFDDIGTTFVGDTIGYYLNAQTADGNNLGSLDATWASSNPAVIRVISQRNACSNRGQDCASVAVVGEGTATLTVTAGQGKAPNGGRPAASRTLTAVGRPARVRIIGAPDQIRVGALLPLAVQIQTATGQVVPSTRLRAEVSSDNSTVGTIASGSAGGDTLRALTAGTVRVQATLPASTLTRLGLSGASFTDAVTIKIVGAPIGVQLSAPPSPLYVSQSGTIDAVVLDAAGNTVPNTTVTATSSNPTVLGAAVVGAGLIRLTGVGSSGQASDVAQLTVVGREANGAETAPRVIPVTVTARVRSVQLTPASTILALGASTQLTPTVLLASGAPTVPTPAITYESSDPTVIAVDGQGRITALTASDAPVQVTASAEGIRSNSVAVTTLKPSIVFKAGTPLAETRGPISVPAGGATQVQALVSNAAVGSSMQLVVRQPNLVEYNASASGAGSTSGSLTGKGSGSTYLVATYTAGALVVRDSVLLSVGNNTGSRVVSVILEPRAPAITAPTTFTFRPRFIDATGTALTTAELLAEGGSWSFFNTDDAVLTLTPSLTAPTAGVSPKAAGKSNVTVLYRRNGQIVATDNTDVTVNAAGSSSIGSITLSTPSETRTLHVGSTLSTQVVVRNTSAVILDTGVTGLVAASSDTRVLTVSAVTQVIGSNNQPQGYQVILTGVAPGTATVTVSTGGVSTTVTFLIIP